MEQIRRLSRKTWITRVILGVFVLWSGMFICLLPDAAPRHAGHNAAIPVQVWHSDCIGGSAQTFCKSDGHSSIHSWMPKFAAIDSDLADRIFIPVVFDLPVFGMVAPPEIKPPRLFLFLCSFLK